MIREDAPKALVLGAGFSGLSAASHLALQGFDVEIIEKHSGPGGRARMMEADGFRFDMGPSWYWMPDVFEQHFESLGAKQPDYYRLTRLDPSYRMVVSDDKYYDLPASMDELRKMFEKIEPGAANALNRFLEQAEIKYNTGVGEFVHKPSLSISEFLHPSIWIKATKLALFSNMKKHLRTFFKHPDLLRIMEFPVLFLGALPEKTPALYSLMNYADLKLGTWYPEGGMFSVVEGMEKRAKELGVKFRYSSPVHKIKYEGHRAIGVETSEGFISADVIVSSIDYHHTETELLDPEVRNYSDSYWASRTMAPSCLLYYVGVKGKINRLLHHTLFFDRDLNQHGKEIYENPSWPQDPLFYVCCPSKTDNSVAPEGYENLFLLIPVAPGLQEEDNETIREHYFNLLIGRLEKWTGEKIQDRIVYKKSYAHKDFLSDYGAFQGNAYGLANTLKQTAILKPQLKNKSLSNLYYTGQLTVPGPGVPPALISGKVVAKQILKDHPSIV